MPTYLFRLLYGLLRVMQCKKNTLGWFAVSRTSIKNTLGWFAVSRTSIKNTLGWFAASRTSIKNTLRWFAASRTSIKNTLRWFAASRTSIKNTLRWFAVSRTSIKKHPQMVCRQSDEYKKTSSDDMPPVERILKFTLRWFISRRNFFLLRLILYIA